MVIADTVVNIFSGRVKQKPGNTALSFRNVELTYQELDERSNQLAHYLIAKGVKPETLVPICVNRSVEMIVGIIGIIKAGGAYVPVDPQYPAERIAYIIGDTQSKLILSNNIVAKDFPVEVINLDDWSAIGKQPVTAPEVIISPENLMYIIYTSGSTGKPKGVMIEHRSLATYIDTQSDYLKINGEDCIMQFSNYCFDASVEQIFLALLNGAHLVLTDEEVIADIQQFSAFLKDKEVTHLHATPGYLENLPAGDYPHLKRIISAGDLCKKELFRKWLGKVDFYNKYGPTEATISALEYLCPAEGVDELKALPIGTAIPSTSVYLLNDELKPVEAGATGEIYIGGIQVARGYFNRPDLTEKAFIKSPLKDVERLYKTGDLARYLPDGNVEFQGRIDDQVKIRGYRIELAEIENTLREAPAVSQCLVVADDDNNNGKRLVAYVVADGAFDKKAAAGYLLSKLPEYMVPQLFVELESMPLTRNGKIDKKALKVPDASELLNNAYVAPKHDTEKKIIAVWKNLLSVKRVGVEDNFFELGGNSLLAQKMVVLLKEQALQLPVTKLYQYPTVAGIASFLDGRSSKLKPVKKQKISSDHNQDIAVIGMAGRFPGADTIAAFWDNIANGRESIHFFADEELDASIPDSVKNNPNYVKARGIIDNPAAFDPAFFGISPKLAELMDPQQRIFLETAWEALEMSGHVPQKYNGSIGVYAGCRFNTYYTHNVISNKELIENVGAFQVGTVSDKDYLASRTAYSLDLRGPAVNVQSACSTSLLAIAQAVQSIRNGFCDVALAGGSSMLAPVNSGHLYEEGAMLSGDGHCRTFDADAQGTLFSDGAGVVVLKSKEQAEKDGDTIFAIIKGIGLSNDGGEKGSFTAPSAEGQAQAIMMAIDDANISPADISYIEAHGTATPLGDPIEIEGLNMAFGEQERKQYCAIGSVKSNFGHLTSASGVVGLIKTSLALYHKQLPPSINFEKPNPHIDFANSPFFVNTKLQDWESDKERIAGVSSFGVGGTNVHVILSEAAQQSVSSGASRPAQLISWSAKSEKSLDNYGNKLAAYLNSTDAKLADVAYTLNTGRQDFNQRRFVVIADGKELVNQLGTINQYSKNLKEKSQDIVFMFPGQGMQALNMGRALYESEKVFRDAMDECAAILNAELKENILDVIYPKIIDQQAEDKLKNTAYSQPALFSIGYALGKLWMSWGIFPAAFAGHSIGEFVSAYFAGVFSLPDALKLIATRGRLMADLPGGSMLSVRLDAEAIQPYLSAEIALAAVNSPKLSVLAGTDEAIAKLSDELNEKGIANKLLQTSHAFHSHMMDEVVEPFEKVVKSIKLNEPLIPIASSVTGEWLSTAEATNPNYWAKHLRATVFFGKAVQKLLDESYNLFLELGPGNSTATLARQQAAGKPVNIISTLEKEENGQSYQPVLKALGTLWLNGVEPNWNSFYKDENRTKLTDVPTYAFDNKDYWVNPVVQVYYPASNQQLNIYEQISLTENNKQSPIMRKQVLISQLKEILENASGIEMDGVTPDMSFIEAGLDSLLLTQVAITLKRQFSLPITFRQLNEELGTLDLLAGYLDGALPPDVAAQPAAAPAPVYQQQPITYQNGNHMAYTQPTNGAPVNGTALDLISQQLQLLAMQISLLQGGQAQQLQSQVNHIAASNGIAQPKPQANAQPIAKPAAVTPAPAAELSAEEAAEIKKPFGAAPKIEKQSHELNVVQKKYLASLIERYNAKTKGSKEYTQKHRSYMADPRVVSGFRPATKELVYSVVINKSKGSRIWDIDGNEYIDALNGFGSNMLGYQPDFIKEALIDQIEKGYEIGPQHELAGEVCKLICDLTKFERSALCNTGSEAVLGAMRIARTVTGRSLIVTFTGSYHGITDEVIIRGSKKLKTYPAASGIMPEAVQNMLVLDYGTEESLKIIEERAHEIAAVIAEPIQSRRADFQPLDYWKKLRKITEEAETVLIFDEVISGFRFHPGGVQGLFGVQADIGTYGKVAGGGISIGIIAGKKKFMDALDGGFWQYGDDSIPEVGVTYFAGTFVRHPLALATAKASLTYLKEQGPQLQANLNAKGDYVANTINALCRRLRVPMHVAQFGSLWRIKFYEEYPYTELFFTLMRLKGIHVLEGFACFLTTAHTDADIQRIITCFEESLLELKEVGLIPDYEHPPVDENKTLNLSPVPNAKLGKDKDGNPAWFVKDEKNPGKYLQVTV